MVLSLKIPPKKSIDDKIVRKRFPSNRASNKQEAKTKVDELQKYLKRNREKMTTRAIQNLETRIILLKETWDI